MYIYAKNGKWNKTDSLSDALFSEHAPPVKVAVIGSGGKSTTIARLSEEQRDLGKKVLSITSTHIAKPSKYGVINGTAEEIKKALEKDKITVAGMLNDEGKLSFIGDETYNEVKAYADVILVEADGSKRLPVKIPAEWEPVILPDTNLIVLVFGLSALSKEGREICHRWERAEKILNIQSNDKIILNSKHLCTLLSEGYLKPLRKKYPNIPIVIALNQADNEELLKTGTDMIDALCEKKGIVMSFLR